MRTMWGVIGLLVSGAAVASPWSISVGLGSAIPANARSGAQAETATTAAACGCTVFGQADARAVVGSLGVGYRVNRWVALAAAGFGGGSFQESLTLTGSGITAPATIRDHIAGGYILAEAHHRFAGRWSWAAGAGLAVTRDSESGSITVNGTTTAFPAVSNTRVSAALAASVSYAFTRRWSMGAAYVEIPTVGRQGQQYTAGPLGIADLIGSYRF